MYDDVLVPTDGSDGTDEVLDHALHLAAADGATVHALYVMDEQQYFTTDDDVWETLREAAREAGLEAVEHVAGRADDAGVEVVTEVREGTPARDIVEYAEREGIDAVVMGTHGLTGGDDLSKLGSVTDRVVKNVEVPVLVVDIAEE